MRAHLRKSRASQRLSCRVQFGAARLAAPSVQISHMHKGHTLDLAALPSPTKYMPMRTLLSTGILHTCIMLRCRRIQSGLVLTSVLPQNVVKPRQNKASSSWHSLSGHNSCSSCRQQLQLSLILQTGFTTIVNFQREPALDGISLSVYALSQQASKISENCLGKKYILQRWQHHHACLIAVRRGNASCVIAWPSVNATTHARDRHGQLAHHCWTCLALHAHRIVLSNSLRQCVFWLQSLCAVATFICLTASTIAPLHDAQHVTLSSLFLSLKLLGHLVIGQHKSTKISWYQTCSLNESLPRGFWLFGSFIADLGICAPKKRSNNDVSELRMWCSATKPNEVALNYQSYHFSNKAMQSQNRIFRYRSNGT